ncbi:nucleotidyltransferase family protein [Clostridium neonatale]
MSKQKYISKAVVYVKSREEVEKIIIETLPKEKTDAIYIFGSYNTEFFDEDSDIDIGWFCKDVTDEERVILEYELEKKIGIEIDLVFPNKEKILFLNEVLAGKPIGGLSEDFCNWFDYNIDEIMYTAYDLISMM